jgi:hypothetical protein
MVDELEKESVVQDVSKLIFVSVRVQIKDCSVEVSGPMGWAERQVTRLMGQMKG